MRRQAVRNVSEITSAVSSGEPVRRAAYWWMAG